MKENKVNWLPLFMTNFLSVFNDNLLKNLICFISFLWVANSAENKPLIIAIASGLFVIPYILFSPYAGKLAKIYSKRRIVIISKIIEMPIMLVALTGFFFESVFMVMTALFLMGLQSAMFSPSKYGLIRDIGGKNHVSFGTGTMEMLTFVAVLSATFLAGVVADINNDRLYVISALLMGLAVFGWIASNFIKAEEPPVYEKDSSTLNPVVFIKRNFIWARLNLKGLNFVVLGLSTFWLVGSMLQMNLYVYCDSYLGMSDTQTGIAMAVLSVGIGLGCFLAGLISGKSVKVELLPIGGVGLSFFLTLLFVLKPQGHLFLGMLFLAALFSGFFKIPLNAWMQEKISGRKLGEVLAYNNLMVFVFILIASGIFGLISNFLNSAQVFFVISGFSWLISVIVFFKVPQTKDRFFSIFNSKK